MNQNDQLVTLVAKALFNREYFEDIGNDYAVQYDPERWEPHAQAAIAAVRREYLIVPMAVHADACKCIEHTIHYAGPKNENGWFYNATLCDMRAAAEHGAQGRGE